MLMTIDPEIQKTLEHLGTYDMLKELKTLYVQQADQELLQTVREFHTCKQEEGQYVSSYVLKMKSYIENLERLGHAMPQNLSVSLILVSLRKEYKGFVKNYNMHSMGKTVNELHAMLKLHEQTLPTKEAPPFAPKPKNPPTPKKDNPAKDAICHQRGEVGIFTIELYSFPSTSWVYDTRYGTHICITTQGLRGSRKLKPRALSLYMGDGHRAAVEAIGDFYLCLPSGLVLILHNCHYAPSITRGTISVSRLYKDGFVNRFEDDNSISIFKNNMIYFNAIPRDDIYEIVILLDSTDIESFEKCVACMSGKMARKPYSHQVERAKDLLGLIHTDVCGPFKIMSRQGAYYFITFTDDFSRYEYVYLLKHKHEVFETFKVFQKEVENQLGKTIKLLCYDRGGKYMSQEYLNHLKDHGIIAHRTPPYTPQHNGVSERRNRTLLNMVRSMMSQTTLPKSFWDYAFESALRILNMVPTKKVDKTPYEVWHGQAPKMSYLKVWGCEALVKHDTLTKPNKLEPRAFKCIFVGYPKDTIGYSFYYPPKNKEHELGDLDEAANYKAALLDPESDKWLNAMNVEMQSMKDNEVWELVELPPKAKTVGHKWLFKKKTDMDRAVHTYKACLVAKGFTQTPGIDYEETFSPIANIRAIRILIAIAAFYDYEIWQMDVKTAFLNGYINEERFYMENSKRGTIPMQEKLKLSKSQGASTPVEIRRMQNILYALTVGSIMYAVRCTRPDVAFAQNITSRFQQNLGDNHWTAVKNILKYLWNTKDMFLVYEDADDMKSQTGYVFILNGGAIVWKSTKQSIFATSSIDAEYIAVFDASKEAVWIRKFIFGLGVVPMIEEPINRYCDNTGAIAIAKDHGVTKGARHFHAKVHYLRETVEMGDIKIDKVDTYDNLADPFTKALAFPKHSELTKKIGMIPASSLM
ncbi:retrotransposon protein, putative, ty1-copia subclass [Tanacetum coccineum]